MPLPPQRRHSTRKAAKPKKPKAKSPGLAQYAASTVRPHEEGSRLTRYRQTQVGELVMRFCKWVATAQSRNATGVASKSLRVYRRNMKAGRSTISGRMWAYETRPISQKELHRQRTKTGWITRKAADLSDEVEEVIDPMHPLVKLLTSPNPLMTGQQLLEQMQLGVGLTGDAYLHMVYAGEFPVELWSLAPQFVRPLPSRAVIVDGYVYGRGTENEITIDAAEIVRFTQPNPKGDPYKGFGDLEKCIDAADLSIAFDQHRLNTIDNGAQPGLIVVGKAIGVEQRAQLEEQINRKFAGVRNVGRSMVLTGDVEVTPWSMNEKEMGFLSSDALVRETIANCHDVPVALLTLDSAALATAKAAIPQWELMALKPRCDRIADTLNLRLCPDFGEDIYVCFEEVVTRDDEATRASVVAIYGADLVTKNEARAEIGYDAVDDGDKFKSEYDAEQAERLAVLAPPAPDAPPGEEKPEAKPEPKEDKEEAKEEKSSIWDDVNIHAVRADIGRSIQREYLTRIMGNGNCATIQQAISQRSLILTGPALSCCPNHPRNMRKDAATDAITLTERQLEGIIRSWFEGLPAKLMPEINGAGMTSAAENIIAMSLKTATESAIRGVFLHGYNYGVRELPSPGNAQIMAALTGPTERYLREFEGKMVRSVSETVNDSIKTSLADGVAAGDSVPQLVERMRESVTDMSGVGAERIARTETARAFMASRENAWQESGIVWGKRWQLAPDACEFCETAAREYGTQTLGTPFFAKGTVLTAASGASMKLDYSDVDGPPLHPNDRCSIVMVMKEPT